MEVESGRGKRGLLAVDIMGVKAWRKKSSEPNVPVKWLLIISMRNGKENGVYIRKSLPFYCFSAIAMLLYVACQSGVNPMSKTNGMISEIIVTDIQVACFLKQIKII